MHLRLMRIFLRNDLVIMGIQGKNTVQKNHRIKKKICIFEFSGELI